MERYFKIGELAKLYGIGADTIRYYEELGLISPVRAANGYRMYSLKDVWRMNVIRDLRGLDFSMEQIGAYLKDRSVAATVSMMEHELEAINARTAQLARLRENVQARLAALEAALAVPVGVVERAAFPRRRCYEIREPYTTDEEMDVLVKQALNKAPQRLYIIGNTQIGDRMSWEAIQKGDFHRYDGVLLIDPEGDSELPAGDWLCLRYRGSSKQGEVYVPMLLDYAKKNGLTLTGEVLELILIDIHESGDYEEHITELQARVLAG